MNSHLHRHAGHVIAERLTQMRRTQTWLAQECGVSNNAVTKWIKTGQIAENNARKAAEVLQIDPATLAASEQAPTTHFETLLLQVAERENEAPTLLIHVTQSEFNLLQIYRRATPKSRLMLEVVASNADIESAKAGAPVFTRETH